MNVLVIRKTTVNYVTQITKMFNKLACSQRE